ncbi:unnamed protein product [Hymenolepis diminuta]|uniref:Transmembrane protein 131-like N-terminal domain-containing protein n=1 Tax=Hymenolepis diminuta TaxID=6216 RepID=A0A0R3SDM1_HYMDI|nr:unnamed protein product [Hymenolepis diminuta]
MRFVSFITFQGKYVPINILSDLMDLSCIELHDTDHLSSSLHTELNQLAGLRRTTRINSLPYVSPDVNLVRYSAFELDNTRRWQWFAVNLFSFLKTKGSVIDFFPGLRFSINLYFQLQNAWHSLFNHIHAATIGAVFVSAESLEQCKVPSHSAIHPSKEEEIPAAGNVASDIVWPSILSDHLSVDQTPFCQLDIHFGTTEGLSQLRIHSSMGEAITCHLTLINPTDNPLLIQPILLDDLLPGSMNYTEMVVQLPILSDELFRVAHVPKHFTKFPHHPSQRTGRFITQFDANKRDVSSECLRLIMQDNNNLQNLVSPTCCPLYTLPPRGELNYSITFAPGAFHNESTGNFQPEIDFSILLLGNNLTILETLLLQTTTQTAAVGIRSELIPSRKVEGSERSQTTFPPASFDETVGFNPSLNNAACESTPLAGSIDIARYNLLREDGKPLCPVAVAQNGANLSLCKVPATFLNSSAPDEFFFTFHEARLKSLCADGANRPHPSIMRVIGGMKSTFPFNLFFRLFTKWPGSNPTVDSSRFPSDLQLAWAVDEEGSPIFSSEFSSGLVLPRRIILFNPASMPVWIIRVGFRQSGGIGHTPTMGQCEPHLNGFSVALCDKSDGPAKSSQKTIDGAIREFELKPGDQRWLEVLYAPDFLYSEINVELCLFASLKSPASGRPVWLSKRMLDLEPVMSNHGFNASNGNECSVFQLEPIPMTAKMSPSLARLCYNSLLRPSFEETLWFVLLFIFASNLAGIFVAASFDAIRLIPDTQSNPTTTSLESDPQVSSPQLYNLDFNLPIEQMEGSLSPYLRAVRTTGSQPISEENCNIRRRHANRHSFTNAMSKFMKSLGRSLRTVAVNAVKSVYEPVSRGVCSMGQYFISLLTLFWGQTSMQSDHSVRSKPQRSFPTKTATEAAPMPSSRANQTQNRKIGTVVTEISNISTPRKSLEEVKRTPRQSHGKSNGDLSASVSNITQASGDTASVTTVLTSQSSKARGNGGKQISISGGPTDLASSPKSNSATAKKHSLPMSSQSTSTIPSCPKSRSSKPTSLLSMPPSPSLVMESIKVESASLGVKKRKQFVPQSPQACKQSAKMKNNLGKEAPPFSAKQKSPQIDPASVENLAQRKKSEKKVNSFLKTSISAPQSTPTVPAWQPRKVWRSEVSEAPRVAENDSTGLSLSSNSFGLPPTSVWSITSRQAESIFTPHLNKNHLGDMEFPPLGTLPPKRFSRSSVTDEVSEGETLNDDKDDLEFPSLDALLPKHLTKSTVVDEG